METLAHGLGGRADVPLDAAGAIVGGGLAVLVSFVALAGIWRVPRLDPDAGRPLPAAVARALDAQGPRRAARAIVLLGALAVAAVALLGPTDPERNPAPWALYVTFWVGLVPLSLLLGPVWRAVNPLRTLHRALRRVRPAGGALRRPPPARLGVWPAAVGLAAFAWLELAAPARTDPRLVGLVLLGHALVGLVAAARWGEDWFARGDPFEVYATLLARLAPLGRRGDGVAVLRSPLAGLAAPAPPGTAAVACVLVGATGFDGLTRTLLWAQWAQVAGSGPVAATLGLAACVGAVAVLYSGAARTVGRDGPAAFAPTLLPVAAGYAVAHYFSLLVGEGATAFGLAAALAGVGGDGGAAAVPPPTLVALVQVNAVVLGHLAATAAAHDLALRRGLGARAELPLLAVMVVLTCAGLAVLLG